MRLSLRFGADRVAPGRPSGSELGLALAQLPDALELDLVSKRGVAPYRRQLPAGEGTCAELAETIGLVVDAWLRDLPWHGVGFLRDVPEAVRPGPPENVARHSPTTDAASPAEASDAGPAHQDHAVTLRLGGGAGLGSDATNFGPEATLSADMTLFRGLGGAVFVSALQDASATDRLSSTATARISASRQVLKLAARYAFFAGDANGPRVFCGPGASGAPGVPIEERLHPQSPQLRGRSRRIRRRALAAPDLAKPLGLRAAERKPSVTRGRFQRLPGRRADSGAVAAASLVRRHDPAWPLTFH